ncbi:MAG: 3-deoxy-7-phosphoheptulonate synthase [Chloroflexia bacterium]|nr:3-deoxy-7-phosphoheptulonate synthase [Chloroflexia bacterium]
MVIVMRNGATQAEIDSVVGRIHGAGLTAHLSQGLERAIIGVIGHGGDVRMVVDAVEAMPGVENLVPVTRPFKLSSREFHQQNSLVVVHGVEIGGDAVVMIGGPCSVESREQVFETAYAVRAAGGKLLRGGAYKPRTSPYSFRGMGVRGLEILAEVREETGLGIVTEVMSAEELPAVAEYADMLQIGTRNMHNYNLLEAVGRCNVPVLLKRGMSSTVEEWLLSAEYVMAQGNSQVVLCERGIRTFDTSARNTFDIVAIPLAKRLSHLPVLGDPSQATGIASLVHAAGLGAIAAGADGLIVEVHPDPARALSDAAQQLTFEQFEQLMTGVRAVAAAVGRGV